MIRIVVVDDDTDAAQAIADLCASSGDIHFTGSAANTPDGLKLVQDTHPDVVLADIRMPGPDGITLTRTLAGDGRDRRPRVIALTAFALDEHLLGALGAGASAFLPKTTPWPDIADTIRAVHQGAAIIPPNLTRRLLDLVMTPAQTTAALTQRETQILAQVAAGRTNTQIARHCHVTVGTVRTHIEHLRAKLGATNRVDLALAARRYGLGYTNTNTTTPEDNAPRSL